jgi:putative transferase (TIGR04331 family)
VKLYLEIIDDQFDPSMDYALGPWCFIGAEHLHPDLDDINFVEPFREIDQITEADQATRALANQYAIKLSAHLNELHSRDYSVEYWRSMLILWLVAMIQALWRRYRHIEEFIKEHGNKSLDVHIYDGPIQSNPDSLNDFMDLLLYSPNYDFLISSAIVKKLAPSNWNFISVAPTYDQQRSNDAELGLISERYSSNLVRRLFGRLCFDSVQGTRISRLFFSAYINALPKIKYEAATFSEDKKIFEAMPGTFLQVLDVLIDLTIPNAYTKNFLDLEAAAKKLKYYPGRLLIDHVAGQGSLSQVIVAQALAAGERLIGFQHGAMDGNSKWTPWSEAEKQYYAWISWGWDKQEDIQGQIVPLPSPYLSRFRNKHRAKNENLVFVGAKFFLRGNRFDSAPSPSQYVKYRHSKKVFIEELPDRIFRKLLYRPYVRSIGTINDEEYIVRHFPEAGILRGGFHSQILDCRLLVLDHPGTTLNIAMAANIPTVLFWNPKHWPQCRQIEPLFEKFKAHGMLFDDPREAARFVEENWDDIGSWWNSDSVQYLRNKWAYHYARTSKVWWLHWTREIWCLANGRFPDNTGMSPAVDQQIVES